MAKIQSQTTHTIEDPAFTLRVDTGPDGRPGKASIELPPNGEFITLDAEQLERIAAYVATVRIEQRKGGGEELAVCAEHGYWPRYSKANGYVYECPKCKGGEAAAESLQ
jgi:hypothetical protein